jgi:cyclopropane-fatty-acyl-phospholipid synthase
MLRAPENLRDLLGSQIFACSEPLAMHQRTLELSSKGQDWSLYSVCNEARWYVTKILFSNGSTPLARLGELVVTSFLQRIKHGQLQIITPNRVYTFPATECGSANMHSDLRARLIVVRETFWTRMLTMGDLGFAESYMV